MAPWHTYQVLTKRSARMRDLLRGPLAFAASLPNIWWGVSVEDRKYGLPRVRHLREAQAQVRFLSVEPLLEALGELDLRGVHWVIVGGESGPGARPMHPEWVAAIRDDCERATCRSSSSNGAGFARVNTAGASNVGSTTASPRSCSAPPPRWPRDASWNRESISCDGLSDT